jgi:hypothetical protein
VALWSWSWSGNASASSAVTGMSFPHVARGQAAKNPIGNQVADHRRACKCSRPCDVDLAVTILGELSDGVNYFELLQNSPETGHPKETSLS